MGEGIGMEVTSALPPVVLPPAVSTNAPFLPTLPPAVIKAEPVGAIELLALSLMTKEVSASDFVTHLGLPIGLQAHNMGFTVGISDDPSFSVDVQPVGMTTHKASHTADEVEALWENIFSITSHPPPEAEGVQRVRQSLRPGCPRCTIR